MLLLLLSHFSRVRLCVTPETAAHQAPSSLGFSRQEHWSDLAAAARSKKYHQVTPRNRHVNDSDGKQVGMTYIFILSPFRNKIVLSAEAGIF